MKKTIHSLSALTICMIIIFGTVACGVIPVPATTTNREDYAQTPEAPADLKGWNYRTVVNMFERKGFTNIRPIEIPHPEGGSVSYEAQVAEISVGGDVNYQKDQWVSKDTEVIIRYYGSSLGLITNETIDLPVKPSEDLSAVEQEIIKVWRENNEDIEITFSEETKTFTLKPKPESAATFKKSYAAAMEGSEKAVQAWTSFSDNLQTLSLLMKEDVAPGYSFVLIDPENESTLLLIKDGYLVLDYVKRG